MNSGNIFDEYSEIQLFGKHDQRRAQYHTKEDIF